MSAGELMDVAGTVERELGYDLEFDTDLLKGKDEDSFTVHIYPGDEGITVGYSAPSTLDDTRALEAPEPTELAWAAEVLARPGIETDIDDSYMVRVLSEESEDLDRDIRDAYEAIRAAYRFHDSF
jgi:hypothetical protein